MIRELEDDLSGHLNIALTSLAEQRGQDLASKVKAILDINLERGRIKRYIDDGDISRASDYVWRVADFYKQLHPYLYELQYDKSTEAWTGVLKKLQKKAYFYFLGHNFTYGPKTLEIVEDCAADAAAIICSAHFPYDVEFTPWANNILINLCKKYIRHEVRQSNIPNEKIVALDDLLGYLSDMSMEKHQKRLELQEELLDAIEQLSPARQEVIFRHYSDYLSLKEIAIKMDRPITAIYSLHFYALQDLQKILTTNRNKDE